MDMLIDPKTRDYNGSTTDTLANAVYLRLMTPLGSWWADPTLGSRLHELEREKDLSRVYRLAKQYTEQALQPLIDDKRARSVTLTTTRYRTGFLLLNVSVIDATDK
ncbi:hypothetical protein EKN56_02975 [Limnobaculum zhutongyuii]|uniref:Phage gp46-like protein n=1 Tax=Limnobaculum zhutongyuii TaxID=2498113 RepID=A0A411WHJ8_9GAMM|nr:phage GP46 family protein [Limnobaculum zhutongyuii]QBH95457.1 hypothetical protein EKN56_02975 [Limnobaculum zhutongyuii]TQS88854.1 hypothetical protein ELQ32_09620 [Limnobaculum zhutongyuii]